MKLKIEIDFDKIPAEKWDDKMEKLVKTLQTATTQIKEGQFDIMFIIPGTVVVDLMVDSKKIGKMRTL